MATSRYTFTPRIKGRSRFATSAASSRIYNAVMKGKIGFTPVVLKGGQRLDHIAGAKYGSASLWWVIAAASGIGWGMQLPPGTIVRVPKNLSDVMLLIR
jgi:nucleoid-associated protein YgaU